MRNTPKILLAAAALSVAGACVAQAATERLHTMLVTLPDGSVAHVQYTGDVAPRIEIQPAQDAVDPAAAMMTMPDPFAQMAQISAMMNRQTEAMMHQAAVLQQQGRTQGAAPGMVTSATATMPQGVHMSYVSTTTDADGCTRSVSYTSDGSTAAPKVTEAASDGCNAVKPNTQAVPAKAEAPVAQSAAPGQKV